MSGSKETKRGRSSSMERSGNKGTKRGRSSSMGRSRSSSVDKRRSSSSSLESFHDDDVPTLPPCTSHWKIKDLEAVHIFYQNEFKTVTQILDMIHNETGMFGPATPQQKTRVDKLKDSMAFSVSAMIELAGAHLEQFLERTEQEDPRTELFVTCVEIMLRSAYTRSESVSEDAFSNLFKVFVLMNGLLIFNDKDVRSGTREVVLQQSISSECDIVITTRDYLKTESFSTGAIVSVKNMKADIEESSRDKKKVLSSKTKPVRNQSSSSDLDLEKSVHQEPAIYSRVKTDVLAQHGGELLLHSSLFKHKFVHTETLKRFYPGMLVVGTQVIFTVLEMDYNHHVEIKKKRAVNKGRSYIHYSEPKDLLLKEDRDLLIESFARLSNKSDKTLKPVKA